jgi:teichoic acid transport system ATP-binding protein
MKPKVIFRNVSKKYMLYQKQLEKLVDIFFSNQRNKSFYALRNISFKVYEGETIGVIGINGSGKSTLSNLLAQVVPPTSGEIEINGKSSLIAISAGLNNNLSGIENIELKCLMHGLNKEEIKKITPKIIEFADIGDFIYQPVKNYSSGMKSRLGFAISVHTNPDILIVDEALSVGDQTFYNKCIDKIYEFKKAGKTIIFISHSLSQIKSISDRVMWLHFGEIKEFGNTNDVIKKYQEFIKWFNQLSKEEQRRYKIENLMSQQNDNGLNNETNISNRFNRKKQSKKKYHFITQISFLTLIYLLVAAFMFMDSPLKMIQNHFDNPINAYKQKSVTKKLEAIPINKDGVVIAETSALFLDKDLKKEKFKVRFPEKIFVKEKIGNIYKIEINNEIGYVKQSDVKILDLESVNENLTMNDFLPILSDKFVESYEYFLAFLNTDEEVIKNKLNGLTDESISKDEKKYLIYEFDDIGFRIDQEGKSDAITIYNIKVDSEEFNQIKQQALIVSNNHHLLYFVIDQYNVLIDLKEKTATFELIR